MDRLTKVDGIGQNEIVKCFGCDLERAGAELEHCGYCEHWQAVVDRLAAYEDTGLTPGEIESVLDKYGRRFTAKTAFMDELQAYRALGTLEELTALVKARDEGRVVVLPCKVGDTIFVIPSKANFELNKIYHPENNRVYEQIISSVNWYHKSRYLVRTCGDFCSVLSSEYGITWFLTRAEAEAAIGGVEDG